MASERRRPAPVVFLSRLLVWGSLCSSVSPCDSSCRFLRFGSSFRGREGGYAASATRSLSRRDDVSRVSPVGARRDVSFPRLMTSRRSCGAAPAGLRRVGPGLVRALLDRCGAVIGSASRVALLLFFLGGFPTGSGSSSLSTLSVEVSAGVPLRVLAVGETATRAAALDRGVFSGSDAAPALAARLVFFAWVFVSRVVTRGALAARGSGGNSSFFTFGGCDRVNTGERQACARAARGREDMVTRYWEKIQRFCTSDTNTSQGGGDTACTDG